MKIHREGYSTISTVFLLCAIINIAAYKFISIPFIFLFILLVSFVFFCIVVQFFRYPKRQPLIDPNIIVCPCDGKVVVIEETIENEYFKEPRLQVSIFMSPMNVHANWNPVAGVVKYFRYHPGLFLVAWHPKSSTENERTTIVYETEKKQTVLVRQIAGAVARRIVNYTEESAQVAQCGEMGFIKFGSRVDLFLPLDAKILVNLNDRVSGSITAIAQF